MASEKNSSNERLGQHQAYQPGVGAPVNQQYLHQQDGGAIPSITYQAPPSDIQPSKVLPVVQNELPHSSQYSPPPPGGPSVNAPAQPYFPPPPQAGSQIPALQEQPYFPPPPAANDVVTPQTNPQFPPPPPSQGAAGCPSSTAVSGAQQPPPGNLSSDNYMPPLPPRRHSAHLDEDDLSNPVHYTRDPHKLVAYMIPFPKPLVKGVQTAGVPDRFLIYTPPPPPLIAPAEGVKEDKLHKVQRKWQEEVRIAKTSDAKTASWKGVKSKATKGISYVMSKTTSSNLDFVNRIPSGRPTSPGPDKHHDDGKHEADETHKTVGLEEMVLVYPSSFQANPEQMRIEFVNSMMRTRSKAQKDAVIATGLLPVSAAIDILATFIWPFGGLLEADGVWAYSSIRGAKTARSVTKRLTSTGAAHHETEEQEMQGEKLRLNFVQSPRLEVLYCYLAAKCVERDPSAFPRLGSRPTETEVLNAIGWAPSQDGSVTKNWEDEQWETEEVKEDMKMTLGKAAKEWDRWCQAFAKNPEKALKK